MRPVGACAEEIILGGIYMKVEPTEGGNGVNVSVEVGRIFSLL